MKLYVIRHGETNMGKKKLIATEEEPLNENGIIQAKKIGEDLRKLDIHIIYCSPIERAKHTCEIINANNIPVIYDDRLIERDGGVLTNTILDDYYFKEYYNYYSDNVVDGLETLPVLFKRTHSFLDEIKEKYYDKNILIVTHGAVARAMQFYFEELPEDGMLLNVSGLKNCEIKEYEL